METCWSYGQMNHPAHWPLYQKSLYWENSHGSLKFGTPGFNTETRRRFCDGLGSNNVVQYSFGPIITLHCQIAAREYMDGLGNQVRSVLQTLFPNNDTVFQEDNAPIHIAETVVIV
jgi:hypothetical protein